jgi:hypothetical protein
MPCRKSNKLIIAIDEQYVGADQMVKSGLPLVEAHVCFCQLRTFSQSGWGQLSEGQRGGVTS